MDLKASTDPASLIHLGRLFHIMSSDSMDLSNVESWKTSKRIEIRTTGRRLSYIQSTAQSDLRPGLCSCLRTLSFQRGSRMFADFLTLTSQKQRPLSSARRPCRERRQNGKAHLSVSCERSEECQDSPRELISHQIFFPPLGRVLLSSLSSILLVSFSLSFFSLSFF